MRERIHTFSFYTLILAVYAVFFSVESFYNFEGHSEAREIISYSCLLHSASATAATKGSIRCHPGSDKARVRLNKRFHQEEIAPFTVYEVSAPVVHTILRELGPFVLTPLPSVTVTHPQLRGPPHYA